MTTRASFILFVPFVIALSMTAPAVHAQTATPTATKAVPTKPVVAPTTPAKPAAPPPPTGAEVGQAIDAMTASCSKALELHTEIAATAERRKVSVATRAKSNAELKKKLRAVLAAQKKVERVSKKPGTDAAAVAETAKTDYEAALAESKTVEVETQTAQAAEDQLLKLVTSAEEASASCAKYEAAIQLAATHARKAVVEAKKHAAKARALAALKAVKALEAARAQQAKELVALKTETESARTAFETLKADAAKQPAPVAKPAPVLEKKKPAEAAKPK